MTHSFRPYVSARLSEPCRWKPNLTWWSWCWHVHPQMHWKHCNDTQRHRTVLGEICFRIWWLTCAIPWISFGGSTKSLTATDALWTVTASSGVFHPVCVLNSNMMTSICLWPKWLTASCSWSSAHLRHKWLMCTIRIIKIYIWEVSTVATLSSHYSRPAAWVHLHTDAFFTLSHVSAVDWHSISKITGLGQANPTSK